MRTKQWLWLIVAIVLFAFVGIMGVVINKDIAFDTPDEMDVLVGRLYGNTAASAGAEFTAVSEDFIAQIDIEGTIADVGTGGLSTSMTCDPETVTDYIDWLIGCESNVGILLNINSGGGTMSASDEIYLKLMEYKALTGCPVYAYFGDTACSGAYYIAMAADEICANRNSICVNIGVYINTYNLAGLFEKYGIEEIMIRSSENKGIGSMGTPWTEEQRAIYQSIVDIYYAQFLDVVASGRDMTPEQVRALDDGREMLAVQALDAGFIDGIGRFEDYQQQVLSYFDEGTYISEQPAPQLSLFDQLFYNIYGKLEALKPRSDGELLQEFVDEQSGIVVMAYAG